MKNALLWFLALILMMAAAVYQKKTGPSYPYRGQFDAAGETLDYRLVRSEETTRNARVVLPAPSHGALDAQLHFKRYKTADALSTVPLKRENEEYAAYLPAQPPAGKLTYFLTVEHESGASLRIPSAPDETIVIRFRGPVPAWILVPHIILVFFAMLIGIRSALAALIPEKTMIRWAWVAFIGMTLGGMILGPIVQKHAFGEYWTGFPFGSDLTDNKMLIMWLCWLVAVAFITRWKNARPRLSRALVVAAAVVMIVVYLIPHSMRGSELDYAKVDQGVAPSEAVGTGD